MKKHALTTPAEIERLVYHMPVVAQNAENDFVKDFAQSVTKQSRRRGWWPSEKQLPLMREMVRDLFRYEGAQAGEDFNPIES